LRPGTDAYLWILIASTKPDPLSEHGRLWKIFVHRRVRQLANIWVSCNNHICTKRKRDAVPWGTWWEGPCWRHCRARAGRRPDQLPPPPHTAPAHRSPKQNICLQVDLRAETKNFFFQKRVKKSVELWSETNELVTFSKTRPVVAVTITTKKL